MKYFLHFVMKRNAEKYVKEQSLSSCFQNLSVAVIVLNGCKILSHLTTIMDKCHIEETDLYTIGFKIIHIFQVNKCLKEASKMCLQFLQVVTTPCRDWPTTWKFIVFSVCSSAHWNHDRTINPPHVGSLSDGANFVVAISSSLNKY